ncbi:hypothetical protein TSOC_009482 [Tetrabaena socialis]|uniref:Ankyrin repeat domain-containing protein n=1 Tax=Tetrabaena socialis TaxID=47790 RepID=A0A2J7ZVT3_9CHLO|nr:hypothetical protein TSOC_009482 [Tetrabaena socialis]|eukprot:PNH04369.1 hypothetical protein TSOC_009482 [Tetrabaena socialis]
MSPIDRNDASAPSSPSFPPPSASAASGPLPDAPGAPGPSLLSLPDRLLQDILALVPGGSPGADGGAPCACAALRAAWREGLLHRAQSAVAALLAEYGERALAATLYDMPGLLLLPGMQAAAAPAGGDGGGGGGRGVGVWPALLCWAAVQVAAQGGCPPHEQATRLVNLGLQKRDAALLRAVLGCTALRPYLHDGAWLAEHLGRAAVAGDPGEGVLRALLDSGVGAGQEHQAARDEALRCAVIYEEAGAARLLLAAGADARHVLRSAVDGSWTYQLRLLAGVGVRFSAYDDGGLLGHAARWGSPAAVSGLLRHGTWERGQVRAALGVATAHNRAEVAGLLRDALAAEAAVGGGGGSVWTAERGGLYVLRELVSLAAVWLAFMTLVRALLVRDLLAMDLYVLRELVPLAAEQACRGLLHLWGRGADGQAGPQEGVPRAADGGLGGGEGAGAAQPEAGSKCFPAMTWVGLVCFAVFRGWLLSWGVKRFLSKLRATPHEAATSGRR